MGPPPRVCCGQVTKEISNEVWPWIKRLPRSQLACVIENQGLPYFCFTSSCFNQIPHFGLLHDHWGNSQKWLLLYTKVEDGVNSISRVYILLLCPLCPSSPWFKVINAMFYKDTFDGCRAICSNGLSPEVWCHRNELANKIANRIIQLAFSCTFNCRLPWAKSWRTYWSVSRNKSLLTIGAICNVAFIKQGNKLRFACESNLEELCYLVLYSSAFMDEAVRHLEVDHLLHVGCRSTKFREQWRCYIIYSWRSIRC